VVDTLSNPLRFILTGGERHDIAQAYHLLEGLDFDRLIADRGYSQNTSLNTFCNGALKPLFHIINGRQFYKWLYREHHLIKCFIKKSSIFAVSLLDLRSSIAHFSKFSIAQALFGNDEISKTTYICFSWRSPLSM
jgi:hypothetical protein